MIETELVVLFTPNTNTMEKDLITRILSKSSVNSHRSYEHSWFGEKQIILTEKYTSRKLKFYSKDFFSEYEQIRRFVHIYKIKFDGKRYSLRIANWEKWFNFQSSL